VSVLLLAVPIALLLAGSAVAAFFWAARDGQFDDLDTPPLRMLLDDEAAPSSADPQLPVSPESTAARREH
jgi:cbb3-type cytochrome oxidase maturation protein